jgi:hypothetical protein
VNTLQLKLKQTVNDGIRQLLQAKQEAAAIEMWLQSPVVKSLQVRSIKRQQLLILQQTIGNLEQQMLLAKTYGDALQRLSDLIAEIHGTARIHIIIRP